MNVCYIENGDYIKVKGVNFGSGATSFEARVASATSGGNIELRLDSPTGTLIGTCSVQGTGGWQNWVTRTYTVSGASGIHDLYFKFTGGSGFLFNFNWWKFYGSGNATPTPTPVTPTPTPPLTTRTAFSQIEAESFNSQSGIQTESCSEGGQDIGYIENGDYVVYNNIDFGSGATGFQARVASNTSGGNIEIRLDSPTGTLVGTCSVANTGGWQTWTTRTCSVSGASGIHNLYLRFTGGSGYLLNVNWFRFTSGGVTPTSTPTATIITPTPTPTPTASVVATPTPTLSPSGGYEVTYNIVNDWGSGATINITITNNTTAAVNGWTLAFTFPGNQQINHMWGGTYTQNGAAVTVRSVDWTDVIGANGGSVNIGFNINYSGTNAEPTSFTLNGTACRVQ